MTGIDTARDTAAVSTQSKPTLVPSRSIDVRRISPAPRSSASRAHSTASRFAVACPLRAYTATPSERCGNVEDDELVDPFGVITCGELGGIAGRAKLLEIHAFDDLAVPDVEARDDAFRQHLARQLHEIAQDPQPDLAGFLGMELHTCHVAALYDRGERFAVLGDRDRIAGDGRHEAVREVDLRAGGHAFDKRPVASQLDRVPPDVRDLDPSLPVARCRRP